jgi:chromosome segregation ATPase
MQERTHSDGQNTGGVKKSVQPDMYITMILSVLGPIVRKLEALDGHIEGWTNDIETYDTKVNTLVGQITSLLTTVKTNEALTWALLVANKQSQTKMENLVAKTLEIGAQKSTLLEIIRRNETRTANLDTKIANLETKIEKLERQKVHCSKQSRNLPRPNHSASKCHATRPCHMQTSLVSHRVVN